MNGEATLAQLIDAALPQTQCRRCGYDDCRHYAQAVAEGQALINRCPPGGAEGIERLARITGLSVMPLDTFVDEQAIGMEVVGNPKRREATHKDFDRIVKKHEPEMKLSLLERFAYYERVRGAFAIVQTGERRLYGNILLKKGIIRPV